MFLISLIFYYRHVTAFVKCINCSRMFRTYNYIQSSQSMGKLCEVVYRRNKKESNIPLLIRYSLLKSIFVEHMTVKEVQVLSYRQPSNGKFITLQLKRLSAEPEIATLITFLKNKSTKSLQRELLGRH